MTYMTLLKVEVQTDLVMDDLQSNRKCKCNTLPKAFVDEPLVVELFEDPPDGLHVPRVHGLVVLLEVDPTTHTPNDVLPVRGIP